MRDGGAWVGIIALGLVLDGPPIPADPLFPEEHLVTVELEELNQKWNEAWLKKDVAAVQQMMAPDYVYIAPTGQVLDRDAILAIIRSPSYRLKQGTRTEMVVRPLTDDAAALVHRWQGDGAFEGKSFRDDTPMHDALRAAKLSVADRARALLPKQPARCRRE